MIRRRRFICPHCGKEINFRAQRKESIQRKETPNNIYVVFPTQTIENTCQNFLPSNNGKLPINFPADWEDLPRNKYVALWNKLPSPFKHKRTDTKVYKESAQSFRELELGIFFRKRTIDIEWAKKWNLQSYLGDRWEPPMILKGLRRLTLLYKDGYWP
ncbi:MAG: hypothetical protein ABIG39_06925, partial [Candidatus Micrarchaeota archaeon]